MFPFRVYKQFVRHKHAPDHWSVLRKKNHPVDKALAHFDDFYKQVFAKNWEWMREGLLGKQKYVAVVNNYSDNEATAAKLELQGALNVRTLFNLEKQYIKERRIKLEKHQKLEEIRRIDRELDDKFQQDESGKKDFSLQASLEEAEIDDRRLVDSKNALSGEILHEFIPATKIKGKEDYIPESTHYQFYKPDKFDTKIEKEYDFHFPEYLNIYCFEESNDSDFDPATSGSTGVLNYYLMDGGSILPILALDIRPGNRILDLCAAPGGKTLLAIQTLYPNCVVANDVSMSRTNRIYKVARQFFYDLEERWLATNKLKITNIDGRTFSEDNFDRVLVDVPCTTDRHSLMENDNNIFKPSRVKERLKLPELQCELLVNALKLVKNGGVVVYSTCSLSPIQNDGVVHMALKQIWEDTKIDVVVQDLGPALAQTKSVFKLANRNLTKYGHLVVPYLPQNYGPTYFCKLKRIN
ncbi:5-methylcytosine rRNA methyltransferase NSUN4 [Asbolus verrucosus]|uniref:NOL1/NOP2/Sun domain family member 4 n=1 Tax=Asbolus verrucosus TaxID=1661398 RepID=A0A482VKS1_ASBVE|nr:5-methylcytosine rRNA methyltransferase NSUN4 [Asbolus verrucosus]